MKKLLDYHGNLKRVMVLRLPGAYPHEEYVDLMLVELPGGDRRFGLLVATGHKAGLVLVKLPQEAELMIAPHKVLADKHFDNATLRRSIAFPHPSGSFSLFVAGDRQRYKGNRY